MSKNLFSKFFVLLLVVGLLFVVAPTTQAMAQTTVSTWDGTYPAERPIGMVAPDAGVQLVNTAKEFAWLASQTNMFVGGVTTVKLNVDIDLANHPWIPSNALGGGATNTFDGNGHTISRLNVSVTSSTVGELYYAAMFVGPRSPAIKNLTIDGANVLASSTVNNRGYAAVLTAGGNWYGLVDNVTIKNSVVGGTKYVAAIVAYGNNSLINCTVQNVTLNVTEKYKTTTTDRDLPHIGGLVGLDQQDGTQIYGNTIDGLTINFTPVGSLPVATDQIGGLIGTAQAPVLVGLNSVSGVTLNGAPYAKLIGLDNRTYKVVNATQMIGYTTIQAAIDATTTVAGDVIEVGPGTYTESLNINKGVTLRAVGLINIVGQATVNASNVTFDGFNLSNPGASYGMVINPGVSNVTVTGNTFENIGSSTYSDNVKGIYLQNGPDSVTIEGNTFRNIHAGTKSVNAVFSGDSNAADEATGLVIRNNVFENITSATKGGYGILLNNGLGTPGAIIEGNSFDGISGGWTHAIGLEGPTSNALINRNVFSGLTAGSVDNTAVFFEANSGLGTTSITNNQFLNSGFGVAVHPDMGTHDPVLASPNWWGQLTGPAAGQLPTTGAYVTSPWCANPECTEFLPAAVSIAPVDAVVCGNTTTTTIDINVTGIPASIPLQGYQFRLHFDETLTSIANLTTDPIDIVNGGFIEDGGFFVINYIDETTGLIVTGPTGIVDISYAQLYPSTSMGDGLLASITLTHLGVPGDIELLLSDVVLSDRDAYVIPSEASATATTLTLSPAVLNTTVDPDAGYCDLASAVLAASAGDTLQLQADITIPTTVTVDKALTLDLNGKVATIPTGGYGLDVTSTAGNLTITDSSAGASGVITGGYNTVWVGGGATFTLDKGSLTGALYGVGVVGTGSTVNVDGGVIDSVYFAITGNGSAGYGGTIIDIDGGAISSDYTAIYVPQAGSVDISAGTISGHTGIEVRSGSLTISGGSITATGQYLPVPGTYSNGSLESGDAIFINTNPDYAGNMIINISGGTFTSATGYAMREYVYDSAGETEVETLTVTGGTFIGGVDSGEAGAAVTFSTQLTALQLPELALKGGLYNTDPASPTVFVFVPYGTVFNTTEQMYEIVGISLNVHDFYYASYDTGHGILLGVSTDFYATNFVFSDAISVTVNLYSGSEGAYVLQQTNELNDPGAHPGDVLTSSFDIFGTYVSNSWTNTKPVDEYGQTVAPTRVEVIVVLPGGTLTGYNYLLTGDRDTILPDISGTIKLQGRSEFASVPLYLTAGEVVISTTTTGLLGEFTFDAVEGYEYTFTTLQPRYLNLTLDSAKLILADKSKTLPVLQLRGGNAVWMNSETETNDIIDINDASLVGGQYGTAGANAGFGNHGDCNFDGKVNVQDLALVGGNFDFQSYDPDNTVYPFAYTAWLQ